jgi:hypothetical protein
VIMKQTELLENAVRANLTVKDDKLERELDA